jgi:uncharacterized membrane protein YkoI
LARTASVLSPPSAGLVPTHGGQLAFIAYGLSSPCELRAQQPEISIMTASKISFITLASIFALGSSFAFAADPATQAKLAAQAKVSEADARTTALAKVPGGAVSSSELEKEHGKLVWSFDIAKAGSKNVTEVQVDAKTGKIVSTKTETPDQEHKEAAAEKKEGKAY